MIAIIRFLGLEQPLLSIVDWLDRVLRRWPWLHRKFGGDKEELQ